MSGEEKWADFLFIYFNAAERAIIRAPAVMATEKWKFYRVSEFIRKSPLTRALQMDANGTRAERAEIRDAARGGDVRAPLISRLQICARNKIERNVKHE